MLTRNRIRRTLDCLEAREVPATLVEVTHLPFTYGGGTTVVVSSSAPGDGKSVNLVPANTQK
jgi:hypothetical protein